MSTVLQELRQGGLGQDCGAVDVGEDHVPPLVRVAVGEITGRGEPGVCHGDVDAAKELMRCGNGIPGLLPVAGICHHTTNMTQAGACLKERCEFHRVTARGEHRMPGPQGLPDQGGTDPAGAARDK
ncbi:hypothetical protein D3C73_1322890 [compost metagenome]